MTVVLLLIAAACLTAGLRGIYDPDPETIQVAPPSTAGGMAPAPYGVVPAALALSVPVELRIPAIDVAVPVSALGLNSDGTVQVPTDYQDAGWFQLGPPPGQVGSAVILGHFDSYQGPAVFYRLPSLLAGDQVEVSLADGTVAHFVVDTVATYLKEQFPAQQVYGSHGYSALQLVTCGGEFDTDTRSYLSNVVAFTSLASVTPAPATTPPVGQN